MKLFVDNTYFSSDLTALIFNMLKLSFERKDPMLRNFVFNTITIDDLPNSITDKMQFYAFRLLHDLLLDPTSSKLVEQLDTIIDCLEISDEILLANYFTEQKRMLI